jgi:hypothetical protein
MNNLNVNIIVNRNKQLLDFYYYRQIYIFINSLIFGMVIISMSNKNENSIEKNKQILYIAGILVLICELEYMGLL